MKMNRNTLEMLEKAEQDIAVADEMEKSFDAALEELENLKKSEEAAPATPAPVNEPEPVIENEDGTIIDRMQKSEEGIAQVVDVEPFLKSLVEAVQGTINTLGEKVAHLTSIVEEQSQVIDGIARFSVAQGKLTKSIMSEVEAVSATPAPRRSQLSTTPRFAAPEGAEAMNKSEVEAKLITLGREGKISQMDFTVSEGRLNKGMPLAPHIQALLTAK